MPSANPTSALMSLNRTTATNAAAGKKNAALPGKQPYINVADGELMPPPHSLPTLQQNRKRSAVQQPQQRRANGPSSDANANHISRLLSSADLSNAVILSPPTVSSNAAHNNRQRQQQQRGSQQYSAFVKQHGGPSPVAGKTRDFDEQRWEFRPDPFYSSTLPWFNGSSRPNPAGTSSRPFGMPKEAARLQFDALGAGEVREDVLIKSVKHVNDTMSEVLSFARIRATRMGRRKLQTSDISFAARSLVAVDNTLCLPSTLGLSTTPFRHAHGVGAVKSIYAKDLRELDIASHAAQLGVVDAEAGAETDGNLSAADAAKSASNSGDDADKSSDANAKGRSEVIPSSIAKNIRTMRVRTEPIVRHHWLALKGHQPAVPENPRLVSLKRQREEELTVTGPTNPSADVDGFYTAHVEQLQTQHKRQKPHANFIDMHARGLQELSVEQQCLLKSIQISLMSEDSANSSANGGGITAALSTLEKDPGIYPLLPWIIEYVVEGVRINLDFRDLRALKMLMRVVVALTLNTNVLLSGYLHRLLTAILMCVAAPNMPSADLAENNAFRYYAAHDVLLPLLTMYESAETLAHRRVVRFLLQIVQDSRKKPSPGVRYGVYSGLLLTASPGQWANNSRLDAVMIALKGESDRIAEEDPAEAQSAAGTTAPNTPAIASENGESAAPVKPAIDPVEQQRISENRMQHLAIFNLLERKIFNSCQQMLLKGEQITPPTVTSLDIWLQIPGVLGSRLGQMYMKQAPASHVSVLKMVFEKSRAKYAPPPSQSQNNSHQQNPQPPHHQQQQQPLIQQQQQPLHPVASPSLPNNIHHHADPQRNAVQQQHGVAATSATQLPINTSAYHHIPNNNSSVPNGLSTQQQHIMAPFPNHYMQQQQQPQPLQLQLQQQPQQQQQQHLIAANSQKLACIADFGGTLPMQQSWQIPNNLAGQQSLPVLSSPQSVNSTGNTATVLVNNNGNNVGFQSTSSHANHVSRQIVR